jgi:hypothetical protein
MLTIMQDRRSNRVKQQLPRQNNRKNSEVVVKKYAVLCCLVLLLASPVFAQIAKQQSAAKWNQTNTTMCQVPFGMNTGSNNLIVVWTSWQSTSTFTASVADNAAPTNNTYYSAVGPTLQSVSNTSAQIFYAKKISGGADTVTVTYSGTVSSANCVIVEYSGADTMYPLDSVSAGYSYSGNPGNYFDSGTAAPANASLLVFGAGVVDNATVLVPGSGFTSLQASTIGTSASAITEQNTAAITTNNVLQRATACIGPSSITPCSSATGDWVMQMAVFRDASWTVANSWSPSRIGNIRWADQFPGSDIGVKINNAYADCPVAGCVIKISAGSYFFSTPVAFGSVASGGTINSGKPVVLDCGGGSNGYTPTNGAVQLNYTGTTGAAITFNDGGFTGAGMKGCNLLGQSFSNATAGLVCGATSGMYGTPSGDNGVCWGHHFEGDDISGFGVGVMIGGSAFLNTFSVMGVHDNAKNLTLTGFYGNESNKFIGGVLSNEPPPSVGFVQNCVDTSLATEPYDMEFIGVSLDSCGVNITGNSGLTGGHRFRFIGSHLENAGNPTYQPFITMGAICAGCFVELFGTDIQEDGGYQSGRQGLVVVNNTGTAYVGIHGGRLYPQEPTLPTSPFPIVYVSGGYNDVAVHDVEKNGSFPDVNTALSYSSMEYGTVQLGGGAALQIRDQGTCTIGSGGTCSAQTLGHPYNAAPICIVTWAGSCSGAPRCASSTSQVTPSSSNSGDSCTANWIAFGN